VAECARSKQAHHVNDHRAPSSSVLMVGHSSHTCYVERTTMDLKQVRRLLDCLFR